MRPQVLPRFQDYGRFGYSMRPRRDNPALRPRSRSEATPFLTGFVNATISIPAALRKAIRRVCRRQEGVAIGEISRPWVFWHLRDERAEHLLNSSTDEGGGIDERFREHGESVRPKRFKALEVTAWRRRFPAGEMCRTRTRSVSASWAFSIWKATSAGAGVGRRAPRKSLLA